MSEPNRKFSSTKIISSIFICLFVGFVAVVVIPNFIRARYETAANACINNLRQIDGAKQQWALEKGKYSTDVPTTAEISVYLLNNKIPVCPQGGVYTIGRVGEDPKCSVGASAWPNDHVLNSTNNWWTNFKAAYSKVFGFQPRSGD